MTRHRQQFAKESESDAVRFLKKRGYKILEQNYRNRIGEIDIIAKDKNTIVFVEVKARKSRYYGDAKWAVNSRKQRKISMVALYYLKATKQTQAKARFDVVTIHEEKEEPQIEIIKNAFELAYG
ncbi:MAG: YraN family protein [Deltaproteobacteria bacterium]|nr:YraN family protein [Deltaproteobacteria bacterium]MBW1961225.1 YraN family protein [Deltaproteobacteria bacterium]MBW1994866.1 YraN family protein [Deltaproteobacteria bacterium]MBW2151696.1 YraN family protein [Deltaproteobacteria bacterium]